MLETERPDTWEVQGRGELQLAVLVETMRREGFELTVGKPQVVTREIDGKLHEPVERLSIDVPEEFLGVVTQLLALRKGRMEQMVNHGTGWVRLEYLVPARGLIGFRTEFLTETRGTGILHAVFEGYEPWVGEIRTRPPARSSPTAAAQTASVRADASSRSAASCSSAPARRSTRAWSSARTPAPRTSTSTRCARSSRPTCARRAPTSMVRLVPHRQLSLDQALEFIRADECVEVTPDAVRLRKVVLTAGARQKVSRSTKKDIAA